MASKKSSQIEDPFPSTIGLYEMLSQVKSDLNFKDSYKEEESDIVFLSGKKEFRQ